MSKPSYDSVQLLCLPSGTIGITGFRTVYEGNTITWRVAQFGSHIGWVDASHLSAYSQNETPSVTGKFVFLTFVSGLVQGVAGLVAVAATVAGGGFYLYREMKRRTRERRLAVDLHPFFTRGEVSQATRNYIPTRIQNSSSSEDQEPSDSLDFLARSEAIPFFLSALNRDLVEWHDRAHLILADSGMGKTTFLINLAMTYLQQPADTRNNMLVLPLGHQHANEAIATCSPEMRRQTILLLDAFDEDPFALNDYQARLAELMEKVWDFRRVILTCRTQFFPSDMELPYRTGLQYLGPIPGKVKFKIVYISPFDDNDVETYLKRVFPVTRRRQRQKAREVIRRATKLMARPMLLAHVQDLVKSDRAYASSVEIYEAMVDHWLAREAAKIDVDSEDYAERLKTFSLDLAVNIWEQRRERNGLHIQLAAATQFANEKRIDLRTLTEKEISSKSLLNRTADGHLKFAHKSVLEYLLSCAAFKDAVLARRIIAAEFELVDQVQHFLGERVSLPFPRGCIIEGSLAEVLNRVYLESFDDKGRPFLINKDDEKRIMLCWTTTPPLLLKVVLPLFSVGEIYLCYREKIPVPKLLAEAWAETVVNTSPSAKVHLHGTYLVKAQPITDEFVRVFEKHGIQQNLKVYQSFF